MHTRISLFLLFLTVQFSWAQNTFIKTLGTNTSDYGTACIATQDNQTLVLTSGGVESGGGIQFGIAKTNPEGSLLWQKVYNYGSFALGYDAVSVDDGFCIFGSIDGSQGGKSLFVLKTDLNGDQVWSYQLPVSNNDRPVKIITCENGGFLCCSIYNYNSSGYPLGLLTRLDDNGNVLWSQSYSIMNGIKPTSVVELSGGGFAMVCTVRSSNFTYPEHILMIKTDSLGVPNWSKIYYSEYLEEPYDLVANADHELYVTGRGYQLNNEWDGFLLKTDASGNSIFNQFYNAGTFNGEIFRQIALSSSNNVLLLGDLGTFDARNISMLEVSSQSGEVIWSKQYPISPQFTNYPADFYVDQNGQIVFTGDVRPPTYMRDAALIRTDLNGEIMCHTAPVEYILDDPPFNEMQAFVSSFPVTITGQTPISFTISPNSITEKVICANLEPSTEVTWESTGLCTEVCLNFTCNSGSQIDGYYWEFEGGTPANSTEQNPENICFPTGGNHDVLLYISTPDGVFTKETSVDVPDLDCPLGEVPNVISPNGDGKNDFFLIDGLTGDFTLTIVNRWGEVVFQTSEPNTFWYGTSLNGKPVSDGVYFYKVEKNTEVKHGFLHVVR